MNRKTELSYRMAAVDAADPIGLLLALYDTLSGNLRRAAAAQRADDVGGRCAELNHAYMVLGQLESWVDPERDRPLAESLTVFYAYVRERMLAASLAQSAPEFDALVRFVSQVRTTWQQREASLTLEGAQRSPEHPVQAAATPKPGLSRTA